MFCDTGCLYQDCTHGRDQVAVEWPPSNTVSGVFFSLFFFVLPFVCNLGSSVFRVIFNFYPHCWQHAQDSLSWSRSLLRRLFLRWELFLRRVFCPQSYGRSSYSDVLHLLWPALCFSQAPDGGKGRPGTAISWINSSRLTLTPCVSVRMSQTD